MTRWLAEGPSDQSALFVRPDNGNLSTSKHCECEVIGEELEISGKVDGK
jgi:hypothetical protein